MLTRRFPRLTGFVVLAAAGAAIAAEACDLNPQPLPPGDLPSSGFAAEDAGSGPTTPVTGTSSDAGFATNGDASAAPGPPSGEGGAADSGLPTDGGPADASADVEDASTDAPSDAPSDAGGEGG